ncbi:hypothetical protein PSACC_02134 [Paramicrosporidium saccamoebae]|uniref:NAD-dependent epimerase/dehydratase domain-containing protein n=1 Tax=Paramicrosporidium saccamoebae TaxID=1246581 RepID=A0A2H9TK02_9FUNG|nr:hypothetical protein PSACC_02134 [Paramicrosporidium saccamoebae]
MAFSILPGCCNDGRKIPNIINPDSTPTPPVLIAVLNDAISSSDHRHTFTYDDVVGCNGQIGTALSKAFKGATVVGVDISATGPEHIGTFEQSDITIMKNAKKIIEDYKPEWVFHLPAILSGAAEKDWSAAVRTLKVNVDSFVHMLQLAQKYRFRLFCPSTIAAFGPDTPKTASDTTIMAPQFLYGTTKSIDYAIEMVRAAISGEYNCFLRADTTLPMVHIDDCIEGIIKLMSVPRERLTRSVYNIQAMSFNPGTLRAAIETATGKTMSVNYKPDHRQAIADSWPHILDDSNARKDWEWSPKFDLAATVQFILAESELLDNHNNYGKILNVCNGLLQKMDTLEQYMNRLPDIQKPYDSTVALKDRKKVQDEIQTRTEFIEKYRRLISVKIDPNVISE